MDEIDELIESVGGSFVGAPDDFKIFIFDAKYWCGLGKNKTNDRFICTVAEYKERLVKQQLIKLIESACTNDAASIANVIIRNGWVKK